MLATLLVEHCSQRELHATQGNVPIYTYKCSGVIVTILTSITVFLGDHQRTVVMYTVSYKENYGVPYTTVHNSRQLSGVIPIPHDITWF